MHAVHPGAHNCHGTNPRKPQAFAEGFVSAAMPLVPRDLGTSQMGWET